MAIIFPRGRIAFRGGFGFAVIALTSLLAGSPATAEEKAPSPCTEDAMIVFDASGSMSGNQTLGIPNSRPRIDEVRAALARVLPTATKHRRVGLITYGPGPYNQCNVKLDLKPTEDAFKQIMRAVNALVPAGKTPLTSAVQQAAEVLNYRNKPGVIVVVTDGEETCGGLPCELGKQLRLLGHQLTVHAIAFRYEGFSWTGGNSVIDLMCLANENRGLFARANSEQDLVDALEKTLDCPMISQTGSVPITR